MPPKGSGTKPRNSSPIKPTRKPSKTPAAARKALVSEPAPFKAGKQKAMNEEGGEDEAGERESGKDRKKRRLGSNVQMEEEEEIVVVEEEEVGAHVHNNGDKEGDDGSQDIYKELSSKFQSKSRESRKSNPRSSNKSKELKKLEELYDHLSKLINDEDTVGKRREVINQLTSRLTDAINQDIENAKRKDVLWETLSLRMLISSSLTLLSPSERFGGLHHHYADFLNDYHGPLEIVMKDAVQTYVERPKEIEKTIKEFTKLQKNRIKEDEVNRSTSLDSKKIVQHAQKLMLSMIKKPTLEVKQS
ncbi:hypothetical protein I203_101490 [Kwoniella mangroviensis CBS 8507]|uniref:uncharacterized protein n=1 Tax=Kwoniella mangroviensis CBS 8507 TaxID=1296122 RepID=UPI0030399871